MNKQLRNIDIVLYVLYLLGGWQERIHTEDIAIKCFELVPSKFSWVKYRQYPDIMTVWYALGDAEKKKYGALVVGGSERKKGSGKDKFGGWRLSDNGVRWLNENKFRIERAMQIAIAPNDRLFENRRIKSLIQSKALKEYLKEGESANISLAEFAESIVCTVNTKPKIMSERLDQLYTAANILNQDNIKHYLDFCRKKFAKQITGGIDA